MKKKIIERPSFSLLSSSSPLPFHSLNSTNDKQEKQGYQSSHRQPYLLFHLPTFSHADWQAISNTNENNIIDHNLLKRKIRPFVLFFSLILVPGGTAKRRSQSLSLLVAQTKQGRPKERQVAREAVARREKTKKKKRAGRRCTVLLSSQRE